MMQLKQLFFIIFCFACSTQTWAQDSVTVSPVAPVVVKAPPRLPIAVKKIKPRADSNVVATPTDTIANLDSLLVKDSLLLAKIMADSLRKDSLQKAAALLAKIPVKDTGTYAAIIAIPYLPFYKPIVFAISKMHQPDNKDILFYVLVGTVALLGLVKVAFPRYLNGLFGQFFQTSFRQKQGREQLAQDNFPSIMMNALFICCGSIYATLTIQQHDWIHIQFLYLLLYSTVILMVVYIGKYLFLLFVGWVFNVPQAANQYITVVFLSNKVAGITLLPFLLIAAFTGGQIAVIGFTVSMALIIGLLLYRYLISMGTMRNSLNVNALHFFLYLCTVEVLPLLLIYKAFFKYIA